MRIGIASRMDIGIFADCFPSKSDKDIIQRNRIDSASPAVNTLCLSYLADGHFLRLFVLGNEDTTLVSESVEIILIASYETYPINYLWGVFTNAARIEMRIATLYNDLDVIHAHWTYEYAYALRHISRHKPVLCTVRDWAPLIWRNMTPKDKITWMFKCLMARKVLRCRSIHFVANSPYTAGLLAKGYHISAPIIPNSIKDSFFSDHEHQMPGNLEIVCISSSYDKRKNVDALIQAFALVRQEVADAHLTIIGDAFRPGSYVEQLWQTSGCSLDGVSLIGGVSHDQLKIYLDKAMLFVSPSREETFGNTLLEAIARGVPTIGGKNSGAVPYVLHQGEAGYLCDVEDIHDIARVILYAFYHQEEIQAKAKCAKSIIRNEYGQETVCQQHLKLYKSVQQ